MKNKLVLFKANSHYCIFRVHLQQTVVFPQGDRKFPISALMQPTAGTTDRYVLCKSGII